VTRPLAARRVVKRYGSTVALDGVSVTLASGRVHAVIGENGAGKSTLARVLAGIEQPDAGEVVLDDVAVCFGSRRDAIGAGVGFVPQSLSLIGDLSLAENHALSTGRWRFARRDAAAELAAQAAASGISLPLDRRTSALSLAERQLGELLLALAAGARVLLLDEPTSSLGPLDVDRLIERLRRLAADGTAIALVTHRLDEVQRAADDVTVLRRGQVVYQDRVGAAGAEELATLMVGERAPVVRPPRRELGPVRLRAEGLHGRPLTGPPLTDIDLEVRGGEVVGVAGVAGGGQRTLVDMLVGLTRPGSGRVLVDGIDITGRADRAAALGVAWTPEERGEGLVDVRPVADNAVLRHSREPRFRHYGLLRHRRMHDFARRLCQRFDVRPPRPELLTRALSGGNQQKLMTGRELEPRPSVVVAHGPTQGLDLRAAAALHRELFDAAAHGAAVVVISADLDEILGLADRIVVLNGGRLVAELDGHQPDIDYLGRAMAGLI
jgi:simple sugar transport system ATP-binding protein